MGVEFMLMLQTKCLSTHLLSVRERGPCKNPLLAYSTVLAVGSPTLAQPYPGNFQ